MAMSPIRPDMNAGPTLRNFIAPASILVSSGFFFAGAAFSSDLVSDSSAFSSAVLSDFDFFLSSGLAFGVLASSCFFAVAAGFAFLPRFFFFFDSRIDTQQRRKLFN